MTALSDSPATLADLQDRTGLSRATAYRLAVALESHRLVARDGQGRFVLGNRLRELAAGVRIDPVDEAAPAVLARLRDASGESAQLYRRFGTVRRCVAASERASGLRDTVPVGSELSMGAGSAAQVLLAWADDDISDCLARAAFTASTLSVVRRRGWAASVGQRESGVASVSAPVLDGEGRVLAAVSVSGPIDRLTRSPGRLHAEQVQRAAAALSRVAGRRSR